MTVHPARTDAITQRIAARDKDLGGFQVGRVLPVAHRRALGPFVFLDHMGPSAIAPGAGFDVRPHPHIGLSTLTFLFEGAVVHRDSLGVTQEILPGEVNLMTAGRGVVHSERAPARVRRDGGQIHGMQFWLALPRDLEDCAPRFEHRDAAELPVEEGDGARATVIAGALRGPPSPLRLPTATRLLSIDLRANGSLSLPAWPGEEVGVYVVEGTVEIDGEPVAARELAVLASGRGVTLRARAASRVCVLGGAPLDGPREMLWNFVASTRERLAQARADWIARRFPTVPGDEQEFIPYPDEHGAR